MDINTKPMFGIEQESRRAILTLEGGTKIQVTLYFPKSRKPIFPDEMERKFVEEFNKSQPYAVNKVVSVHILRN